MHIPQSLEHVEMDKIVARLRSSSLSSSIMRLYDRLQDLLVVLFVGQRMKLPCLNFKVGHLLASRSNTRYVFRAQTSLLGVVEITAEEDLSQLGSLFLVHPWIDFLLDCQPVGSVAGSAVETIPEEEPDDQSSTVGELSSFPGTSNITPTALQTQATGLVALLGRPFGVQIPTFRQLGDAVSLRPPSSLSPMEVQMQALQVIARLRQPFGALLLTPHFRNVAAYRRVATENVITVWVEEIMPTILDKLVKSARTLDVL